MKHEDTKEEGKGRSYLQRNDGGDGPDHGVLQHAQLAPKEQHSAKAREHSISATPWQQNTNPLDKWHQLYFILPTLF